MLPCGRGEVQNPNANTTEESIMTGKKLLALMIAPLFALGMAACETDRTADDDFWTEEGQLPAYEDPAYDPALGVDQDTVIIPDAHPELPENDMTTEPRPDPQY
jgi:hypothetical protein